MFEACMLQPVKPTTSPCHPFGSANRRSFAEPDLDELMRDPLTLAVMAADRVDACALHALFADVRRNLRA
jgi:hypothetical protein